MTDIQKKLYRRLSGLKTPRSVADLATHFYLSHSTVYNALIDLQEQNLVEHLGYGKGWRVVR